MSVAVTSVQIPATTAELTVGGITNMNASVLPANATNKTLQYESDNPSVATVDAAGAIVGVGVGTAKITVKSANGKTASMQVTVRFVNATGVTVSPNEASVGVGSVRTLTANIEPADASNKAVSWNSSAPAIATVDSEGKVTGVAEGTATITATTEDGGFTATCQVTIVKNDGMDIKLLNPYKGIDDNSNTVLYGDNMLIAVDLKNGEDAAVGENVVLTLKSRNNGLRYEVKNKSAITDVNGRAEFVVGLEDNRNTSIMDPSGAGIYDLTAIRTKANDGTSITQKELTVNTAIIESEGIKVVSSDELEPAEGSNWKPPVASTRAYYSGKGNWSQINQEYVVSQKVSPTGSTSHEVEFTVSANLKYGEVTEGRKDWTWKPEGDDGTKTTYTVYNQSNDETTSTEVKKIPEGINSLRINFSKIDISEFTAIYIEFYDKNNNPIDVLRKVITDASNLPEVADSEDGKQTSIQIGDIAQYGEVRLVVSLVTKGQVKTDGESYILSKIIGTYDNDTNKFAEHSLSNDSYVTWEDVSNDVSYEKKVVKSGDSEHTMLERLTGAAADAVFDVSIPVFPYSGDAFISVRNGMTYLYPTENEEVYDTQGYFAGYKNINVIKEIPNRRAIQVTNAEEATRRCSVTPVLSGNNAVVNSEKTGMTALKATINIPGVEEDVFNSQNGKELYTSVQWAPVTQEGVANDEFYAVEGQSVRIAAQLCDINENKVAAPNEKIRFSAAGVDFVGLNQNNRSIYNTATRNKKVDLISELSETKTDGTWTTDRDGRVEIELQGVMGTSYVKNLTAVPLNGKYKVNLSILGNTDETKEMSVKSGNADIYWVALGLSYTHSADKNNAIVKPFEHWEDGVSVSSNDTTNPVSEFPRGIDWNVGYLPIASITDDQNGYNANEREDKGVRLNVSGVKVNYDVTSDGSIDVKATGKTYLTNVGKNTVKMHSDEIGTIYLNGTLSGTENDLKNVRFTKKDETTSKPNVGRGDSNIINYTTLIHTTKWLGNGTVAKVSDVPSKWNFGDSNLDGYIGLVDNSGAGYVDVKVDYTITKYNSNEVVSSNSAYTEKTTDSKKGTKRGYIRIKDELAKLTEIPEGYRIEATFTLPDGSQYGPRTFGPYYVVGGSITGGGTPENPSDSDSGSNSDNDLAPSQDLTPNDGAEVVGN